MRTRRATRSTAGQAAVAPTVVPDDEDTSPSPPAEDVASNGDDDGDSDDGDSDAEDEYVPERGVTGGDDEVVVTSHRRAVRGGRGGRGGRGSRGGRGGRGSRGGRGVRGGRGSRGGRGPQRARRSYTSGDGNGDGEDDDGAAMDPDADDDGDGDDEEAEPPTPPGTVFRIPPYPQENRSARLYAGPLKKWDRFRTLIEILYGPDPQSLAIVDAMRRHWRLYAVLPRRTDTHPRASEGEGNGDGDDGDDDEESNEGGMLLSPWLPNHFEANQIQAYTDWYQEWYQEGRGHPDNGDDTEPFSSSSLFSQQAQRQQSHSLSADTGQTYLPHSGSDANADLLTLLGPLRDDQPQQAVIFRPGQCHALRDPSGRAFDEDGTGAEGAAATAESQEKDDADGIAGWMLHAGGIVLSMAWAPRTGHVDQLLALAVVPYSDQELRPPQKSRRQRFSMLEEDDEEDEEEEDEDRDGGGDEEEGADEEGVDEEGKGAAETGQQTKEARNTSKGSIQFWSVSLGAEGARPDAKTARLPHLERVCCFDWGRPKQLQWCPVPLAAADGGDQPASAYGLLAVLTGDGVVRVIDVKKGGNDATQYEYIDTPVATFGLPDEYNVTATCMTWLGVNRLALGHSDGSITLWSVRPALLLLRHPVHVTHILDICSGYPSYPYLVASRPVAGLTRLVDLTRPSSEHTFHPNPVIGFQPGLLDWCDHMQGFAALAPSNNPLSTKLDFAPARFFMSSRTFFPPSRGGGGGGGGGGGSGTAAATAQPMCLSVGRSHPYVLVGRADGSLWSCNMLRKVFPDRAEQVWRIKLFENEFRPPPPAAEAGEDDGNDDGNDDGDTLPSVKGAVRFLQGFAPERNEITKPKGHGAAAADSKKRTSRRATVSNDMDEDDDGGDGYGDENVSDAGDEAGQTVIHDPLTRISAVAWNPNIEYGWWAAAGMASGLVRILDLGVEPIEAFMARKTRG
ncbi:transcription factor tfiiic complex subunit [Niveomyces insectorum RCEF 264]|uniref:Transcription factor tfiiic complex subunit n=1 Tax=Niveomyces insectorum RCEF 264 TaxID=1081102 RepID=A0A167REZ0_9HYPO|nr:transcription factor tfiiic complex subunit [Niveomyces insectorum RCEF 264]